MSDTQDLSAAIFAKTELGQQEIQSRSLALPPLMRRILVLVDGKRNFTELGTLLPAESDLGAIIQELLKQGCVQVHSQIQALSNAIAEPNLVPASAPLASAVPAAQEGAAASGEASGDDAQPRGRGRLPPAETRTAKENEMARNFMINSVNSIIGQNMRISLIHDIFHSETTEQLRDVYLHWVESMSNHGMGAKRLPELKEKLFKVL